MPALVIGIDVKGDEALADSFRQKGSALQRAILKHTKQLGSSARAVAMSLTRVRTGETRSSITSRVSVNSKGSVTLTVRPGKRGWRLAFQEFRVVEPMVKVKAYQRAGASYRPIPGGRVFRANVGTGKVSAYKRRNRLHFQPAITPARDYIALNSERVMREAVEEALLS